MGNATVLCVVVDAGDRLTTPGDTVNADAGEAEDATTVAKAIAENFIVSIYCILQYLLLY